MRRLTLRLLGPDSRVSALCGAPLTDATIGIYAFATVAGFVEVVGTTERNGAIGWWLGLILGLIATVPTALTGLADWLTIKWRSDLWWTATFHLSAMVTATVFFGLAAIFGHNAYTRTSAPAPMR